MDRTVDHTALGLVKLCVGADTIEEITGASFSHWDSLV